MFWSHPAIRAGIHRSYLNADQEDDENIWNSDSYSGNPDHMAIDHEKRQIYWLLSDKSLLFMSNFDGSGLLSFPSLFKRPVALTVLADITYCIDLSTGSPSTGSATTSQGPHLSLTQCNLKGIRLVQPLLSQFNRQERNNRSLGFEMMHFIVFLWDSL